VLDRNMETERTTILHPNPFLYGPDIPFETTNYYTTIELPEGAYKAHDHGHEDPPPESPSFKRLFGRTSAWACTTLYLTSRLPQIWKNVSLSPSPSYLFRPLSLSCSLSTSVKHGEEGMWRKKRKEESSSSVHAEIS
jgi:hypothetical protein